MKTQNIKLQNNEAGFLADTITAFLEKFGEGKIQVTHQNIKNFDPQFFVILFKIRLKELRKIINIALAKENEFVKIVLTDENKILLKALMDFNVSVRSFIAQVKDEDYFLDQLL